MKPKIYYMRDNHTFVPLSLNVEEALETMAAEFAAGQTYGMLCSKHQGSPAPIHAGDKNSWPKFAVAVKRWYADFPF